MSVIDICLGLHPFPTGSTEKGEKGISDGGTNGRGCSCRGGGNTCDSDSRGNEKELNCSRQWPVPNWDKRVTNRHSKRQQNWVEREGRRLRLQRPWGEGQALVLRRVLKALNSRSCGPKAVELTTVKDWGYLGLRAVSLVTVGLRVVQESASWNLLLPWLLPKAEYF